MPVHFTHRNVPTRRPYCILKGALLDVKTTYLCRGQGILWNGNLKIIYVEMCACAWVEQNEGKRYCFLVLLGKS